MKVSHCLSEEIGNIQIITNKLQLVIISPLSSSLSLCQQPPPQTHTHTHTRI
jgi:hypothetical protein